MGDMAEVLGLYIDDICGAAVDIVTTLLPGDVHAEKSDWLVVERLSGDYEHIITLGCSNSDYQGVVMVAAPEECSGYLFGDIDELRDALGELSNQYCGVLMDKECIVSEFGVLSQSVPMYASKRAFFPRAAAVTGKVYVGETYIQIGFALRAFMMLLNR